VAAKEEVACETLVKCTTSAVGKHPGRSPSTFNVVRATSINLCPDAVGMKFNTRNEEWTSTLVWMYVCVCVCVCRLYL